MAKLKFNLDRKDNTMTDNNGNSGTKIRIILWLAGVIQAIVLVLGGYALSGTSENKINIAAMKSTQTAYSTHIGEIKSEIKQVNIKLDNLHKMIYRLGLRRVSRHERNSP